MKVRYLHIQSERLVLKPHPSLAIGMRGPLYVVAQNVRLGVLEVLHVLKVSFSGGLDDLRTGHGNRSKRLASFHLRKVDCPTLCKSAPSRPAVSRLRFW